MSLESPDKNSVKLAAKALVSAVENFDGDANSLESRCQAILKLFGREKEVIGSSLTSKKQESFMLGLVQSQSKLFLRRFFGGLRSIVELIASEEAYVPESAFEQEADDARDAATKAANDKRAKTCLHFLRCAALCVSASLDSQIEQKKGKEGQSQLQLLPEICDVALQLHNMLLSIHDCGEEALSTRDTILVVCEAWWLAHAPNRDSLIAQALPLFVLQASDPIVFQKSHIIKLLSFKDAFQVIDFLNPSSDSLRALLLKVASNPLCLKLGEGRKFLASLFRDPDLVSDLHFAFRAQIPQASKTILQAYGDVYFKAWCEAEDAEEEETKEVIEHKALQDLMHCAIHVATPAMAKNVLTVLTPIHMEKKSKRVADLLYRLYSPILWRSLSAANPIVRKNAIVILDQVFPLQDPNQSQMKASIEKCTHAIKTGLQDIDPKVRVAASQVAANICGLFWEALPSSVIRMLLNHVVLEHASDVTSAAVRAQALLTTASLLEIPQSHAVLRPLLPSLGNLIHDKTEKVRLAAVKLLRHIKRTRGIHFYHVVPLEHLSARLSDEAEKRDPKNAVNKELTALMLSSYFPQGENVSAGDQIKRTIAFLLTDPSAAAAFYANLAHFLDVESVAKFVVMLLACLKSAVQNDQNEQAKRTETKKKRRRTKAHSEGEIEDNAQKLSATNTDLMVGLVETIHTLVASISGALDNPTNEPSKNLVHGRLREAELLNTLTHFEQKAHDSQSATSSERAHLEKNYRICRAILRCFSLVPKKIVPGVPDFVVDSLKGIISDESVAPCHALSHLSLLATWGLADDIALAIATSIESSLNDGLGLSLLSPSNQFGGSQSLAGNGKKKKGLNSKLLVPEFSTRFAFDVLDAILSGEDSCALDIRGRILSSEKATNIINSALVKALKFAEQILASQPICDVAFCDFDLRFVLGCCEAYGRLALHRSCREGIIQLTEELEKVVVWTTMYVLPVLTGATAVDMDFRGLDLSRISNVSDSLAMGSSPGLISPPRQRKNLGRRSCRLSEVAQNSGFSSASPVEVLAQLLMQSASLVIAEFLQIGGTPNDRIVSKLSSWVSSFGKPADSERTEKIKSQLLPGFVRLGLLLSKKARNFTVLQQAFLICGSGSTEDVSQDMLKQAVRSLLPNGLQTVPPFMADLTDAMLLSGVVIPVNYNGEFQVATSADEVLPGTSLGAVLDTCVRNPTAGKYIADELLSKILSNEGDTSNEVIFYGRCLSYLVSTMQSEAFNEKVVEAMSIEQPRSEGICSMLEKIVYVGAR